jgi:hypothetical protein
MPRVSVSRSSRQLVCLWGLVAYTFDERHPSTRRVIYWGAIRKWCWPGLVGLVPKEPRVALYQETAGCQVASWYIRNEDLRSFWLIQVSLTWYRPNGAIGVVVPGFISDWKDAVISGPWCEVLSTIRSSSTVREAGTPRSNGSRNWSRLCTICRGSYVQRNVWETPATNGLYVDTMTHPDWADECVSVPSSASPVAFDAQ